MVKDLCDVIGKDMDVGREGKGREVDDGDGW